MNFLISPCSQSLVRSLARSLTGSCNVRLGKVAQVHAGNELSWIRPDDDLRTDGRRKPRSLARQPPIAGSLQCAPRSRIRMEEGYPSSLARSGVGSILGRFIVLLLLLPPPNYNLLSRGVNRRTIFLAPSIRINCGVGYRQSRRRDVRTNPQTGGGLFIWPGAK